MGTSRLRRLWTWTLVMVLKVSVPYNEYVQFGVRVRDNGYGDQPPLEGGPHVRSDGAVHVQGRNERAGIRPARRRDGRGHPEQRARHARLRGASGGGPAGSAALLS